jgi:hypothetical protein
MLRHYSALFGAMEAIGPRVHLGWALHPLKMGVVHPEMGLALCMGIHGGRWGFPSLSRRCGVIVVGVTPCQVW